MATAISILDAQATPVAKVFSPVGFLPTEPDVFLFEDRAPGSFIGFNRIKCSVLRPTMGNRKAATGELKVRVQLMLPQLETLGNNSQGITPPDQLAYVTKCDVIFTFSERATQLHRDNAAKMLPLLLNDAQIQSAIKLLQRVQ